MYIHLWPLCRCSYIIGSHLLSSFVDNSVNHFIAFMKIFSVWNVFNYSVSPTLSRLIIMYTYVQRGCKIHSILIWNQLYKIGNHTTRMSHLGHCEGSPFCVLLCAATEERDLQSVAVEATTRLKQALTNEREAKLRAQAELELVQVSTRASCRLWHLAQ